MFPLDWIPLCGAGTTLGHPSWVTPCTQHAESVVYLTDEEREIWLCGGHYQFVTMLLDEPPTTTENREPT